ncbi:MAG: hypothetical protein ACLQSR_08740 [Limisphaerales bacterium]
MTHQIKQPKNSARLPKWSWLCGLLVLAFAHAMFAADALYENDGVVDATIPPDLFQTPDATNFVNNNWFQLNFEYPKGELNNNIFESEDTLNYTNNGTMVVTGLGAGGGFNFDTYNTQSGLEQAAASFYNAGSIRANSLTDGVGELGDCFVNATNIISPGTLDIGVDGLMQLTGQNIDLTRGTLTLETISDNIYASGAFGVNTNILWNPSVYLGPNFAESSYPFQILLGDSTPYFNFATNNGGTNIIIRSAFVEDYSTPAVPFNVYFDSATAFGGGNVTVEWITSYTNYATGLPIYNYLYLNDNYVLGASTNVALAGTPGYPDNFTFIESPVRLNPGAQANPGFYNVFPNESISNNYSYVEANLISTTTPTNAGPTNPSGALTNLPGRLQINASRELTMNWANITQPNYLSLVSTNQFNGSIGASIAAPYSDVDLGVTNGFLTVSNLLEPYVPVLSGTIFAWSTEFLTSNNVVTNITATATNVFTPTNDFRVLIAASEDLSAISLAYVQNLTLHSTNLVLSDALNLLNKLSIDAQNLTLTTNPFAAGAASPAGELLWENPSIMLSNSLPNLLNLTNYGVISTPNLISLGALSHLNAIINNGTISDEGTAFWVTNFQNSGSVNNGVGAFQLNASTVTLTNGSILAPSNDISIAATTIEASNVVLDVGSALTFSANALSDGFPNGTTGLTNGNVWSVGADALSASKGLYLVNGINLLSPALGGLLGTTIESIANTNVLVNNLWAAHDYGVSNVGFTNNAAIGQLILNAVSPGTATQFYFSGTGASNAIYVDHLELDGYASYLYHGNTNSIPALGFDTNLVIYYADATAGGVGDVSFLLNGFNGNHLRWVPTYVGYFSSTTLTYPGGYTYVVNKGLADSQYVDSNGNGTPNASDPTPFFEPNELNFMDYRTNNPLNTVVISFDTVPLATNAVYFSTNLLNWQLLTNMYLMTNPFISPNPYPGPATNVMVLDPITGPGRFYQVIVSTDLLYP